MKNPFCSQSYFLGFKHFQTSGKHEFILPHERSFVNRLFKVVPKNRLILTQICNKIAFILKINLFQSLWFSSSVNNADKAVGEVIRFPRITSPPKSLVSFPSRRIRISEYEG